MRKAISAAPHRLVVKALAYSGPPYSWCKSRGTKENNTVLSVPKMRCSHVLSIPSLHYIILPCPCLVSMFPESMAIEISTSRGCQWSRVWERSTRVAAASG
jgi:hypothetical protein